jgi:hypothetical protein
MRPCSCRPNRAPRQARLGRNRPTNELVQRPYGGAGPGLASAAMISACSRETGSRTPCSPGSPIALNRGNSHAPLRGALSRAPHRTVALAHGPSRHAHLPSPIAARGRRTVTAPTTKCRLLREVRRVRATREATAHSRESGPTEWATRDPLESAQLLGPAASDGQQPILTRSPVGPFMPSAEIGWYVVHKPGF